MSEIIRSDLKRYAMSFNKYCFTLLLHDLTVLHGIFEMNTDVLADTGSVVHNTSGLIVCCSKQKQ